MDSILSETAKQVPNMAMLGIIVWLFLAHLTKRDEAFNEVVRHLHRDADLARSETILVIRENTESNRTVSNVMADFAANCPAIQKQNKL